MALLSLPLVAQAQVSIATGVAEESDTASKAPWRGSTLTYSHMVTPVSLVKSAMPWWNPYYAHQITLRPNWHFNDSFFAAAQLSIEQELTVADDTTRRYEVMLGDLLLEGFWTGWREPTTQIRVSAAGRLMLPTSKASRASSMVAGVAPSVTVSRGFDVLSGLSTSFLVRGTRYFNQYTTRQYESPSIIGCGDPDSPACSPFWSSGTRNVAWNLTYGPVVSLGVTDKLSFSVVALLTRSQLYALTAAKVPTSTGTVDVGSETGINERYSSLVSVAGTWMFTPAVGVTLSAYTWASTLGLDGKYRNPFFNHLTTCSLDLTLDVERLAALATGRP